MTKDQAVRLSIETLLEVVENSENVEICVVEENKIADVEDDVLKRIADEIIKEKQEAEEAKKKSKKD